MLNTVTPTEATQELRAKEAVRAFGSIEILEEAGFFDATGIDPGIQARNFSINHIKLAAKGPDGIVALKRAWSKISERVPFFGPLHLEDC